MKTSSRNQFAGIGNEVQPGAVKAEVDIELKGNQHHAIINVESEVDKVT